MHSGLVALIATLVLAGPAVAAGLERLGDAQLIHDHVEGLSGIELSPDGAGFVAVSDRGWFITGSFTRIEGELAGATLTGQRPILGLNGLPVAGRRLFDWADAEGLAIAPDGSLVVSFERWAHIARFTGIDAVPTHVKDAPEFRDYADNRQLEAVAVDPEGRIVTMPERPKGGIFPVHRHDGTGWTLAGELEEVDGFSVVGADYDADGTLYLLERKLFLGLWWQSRIRRVVGGDWAAPEILWTSGLGEFDNFEGLSVWRDGDDRRLIIVSDDNNDDGEPTTFMEFRLIE